MPRIFRKWIIVLQKDVYLPHIADAAHCLRGKALPRSGCEKRVMYKTHRERALIVYQKTVIITMLSQLD